eukprot:9216166-Lingulodinium_polyedra.AAC.1
MSAGDALGQARGILRRSDPFAEQRSKEVAQAVSLGVGMVPGAHAYGDKFAAIDNVQQATAGG